ncbi:GNAT family N-acetyltransferase [Psychrobacillus sp. FJAT-21963]|uniref:GNAT family N-acetyltransferase n=1 Tax=Psychrobacillus sp. FJAT-21963 TaxID=1712028 RepID=UPI0006FE2AE3|nr:GNAT family N-acetyltransferase [Psychrobacillus sp. FJAT-21963]KQL34855.1 2-aminoglycoside phosphotransferase [Psychrobacillus sp. FJAT-21963]
MLFQKGRLIVRELDFEDRHKLAEWLSNPVVLEFYEGRDNPFNVEKVIQVFFHPEDEVGCMVEWEEEAVGYIQFYRLDDETKEEYGYTQENIYGMDQFIGENKHWNKGIGQKLVRTMVSYLIEHKQAEIIVMDPQTWNKRAIHCYEKCGFKKIKLLPKRELHEGEYKDCWLMEYKS